MSDIAWPGSVAVVGAGTMGAGIALVFAAHGVPTAVVDASPELSEEARARAVELLARLEAAGSVESGATATAERHLSAAATIADSVAGAHLVVEAVFERPDVKA
ncbi:MAG: 3-hydroxyacyl-CoA dehydrogenase NAD-binding domain-containing protein, partial [Gaiella sp.]